MIPFEIGCKITSKIWNNKHFISFFVENLSFCHFIDINQGKRSFPWPLHVPEHNQSHIYIIKWQGQTKVILRYFNYEHRLLMRNHIISIKNQSLWLIALRAVTSTDAMTADWAHLPYDFMAKVSNEIINKVRGVNRVCYDISSKPPATIEWE